MHIQIIGSFEQKLFGNVLARLHVRHHVRHNEIRVSVRQKNMPSKIVT